MTDGRQGYANLKNTPQPLQHPGSCLYYNSNAYHDAGARYDGSYATAYQAAMAVPEKYRHYDENPPYGALIYLGKRLSDGNMDGDVFSAGPDSNSHAATDQPTWGKIGLTSIAGRKSLTGREYLFWSEWFMGALIDVYQDNINKNKDDNMKTVYTKYASGQVVKSSDAVLLINSKKDQTVEFGPGQLVSGALYIALENTTPDNVKVSDSALAQVRAQVDTCKSDGTVTSKTSLGTVEIIRTEGQSSGFVPVPSINLDDNQRLRFYISGVGGQTAKVSNAVYRGQHAG